MKTHLLLLTVSFIIAIGGSRLLKNIYGTPMLNIISFDSDCPFDESNSNQLKNIRYTHQIPFTSEDVLYEKIVAYLDNNDILSQLDQKTTLIIKLVDTNAEKLEGIENHISQIVQARLKKEQGASLSEIAFIRERGEETSATIGLLYYEHEK